MYSTERFEDFNAWLEDLHYPHNEMKDDDSAYITFPWCDYAVMYHDFDNGNSLAILKAPENGRVEAKFYTEEDAKDFLKKVWQNYKLPNRAERRRRARRKK